MREGSVYNAYMDGRLVMAKEIMSTAKMSTDLFSEANRLDAIIKWCRMEIERTEMAEKTLSDLSAERSERDEYARYQRDRN